MGQVVSFCFMKYETKPFIRRMLTSLKERNSALEDGVVFLTDKDFVEQEAILEVFPSKFEIMKLKKWDCRLYWCQRALGMIANFIIQGILDIKT